MARKIEARFIIEIGGKPVENVEKALNLVLKKLNEQTHRFKLIDSHVEKPELDEETTLYGGFIEAEVKFSEVKDVLGFILDYTPTSIEVLDPEKLELNLNDLNDLLNGVSSVILNSQNVIRQLNAQVKFLSKKVSDSQNSSK